MISDLPVPDRARLAGSPLELVVWQLQFAEPADVRAPDVGRRIAEAMSDHARARSHLRRIAPPAITLAVGGSAGGRIPLPDEAPVNGWQVRAGELVATIDQSSLAVETAKFEDWESFQAALAAVVDAFADCVREPPGEQRLGLRYVDRIIRPEVQRLSDWESWLAAWLLGATAHPQLRDAVTAMAQQVDCDAGDGLRVTIRQRAFNDMERRGQPTMLLDFDAFRDGYRSFAANDVLATTDELNDISHRVFRAAITDRLYDVLREEPNVR
jgi:uncharacterized protein (TIGR04255 family)